jgi:DNA-binding MarR family transcriptional regulator/GNAT superfamily N-acetyltransferase
MTFAEEQIDVVREFNRFYTRRLGVLTDRFLGQDRPLSEARLLFEIGDRMDVRELRHRLAMDSGYLSRLLRSLQDQNLVRVAQHPDDGRARIAELTDTGRRERSDLDERAGIGIGEMLEKLTVEQRQQLIDAQQQIRRLLQLAAVVVAVEDAGSAAARQCLTAYAEEMNATFPGGYESSELLKPSDVRGDSGGLLLAREDGRPVGCGVWRALGGGLAEVRHVWVSPEVRGIGLGRRILREVEQQAAAHGIVTLRLATHWVLTEAIGLYRTSGYHEIPVYEESPYYHFAFGKSLTGEPVGDLQPEAAGRTHP